MHHIFKKIIGLILLLFSALILIIALKELVIAVIKSFDTNFTGGNQINQVSFLIGTFLGMLLIGIICYFLIRFGIKLIKSKEKVSNTDILDEEFKN